MKDIFESEIYFMKYEFPLGALIYIFVYKMISLKILF